MTIPETTRTYKNVLEDSDITTKIQSKLQISFWAYLLCHLSFTLLVLLLPVSDLYRTACVCDVETVAEGYDDAGKRDDVDEHRKLLLLNAPMYVK